jgi:hypothetical protein
MAGHEVPIRGEQLPISIDQPFPYRDPLAGAEPSDLYMTTELPAPTGAAQEALLAWCEAHPQGFGDYTKHFVKTLSKSTKGAKSAKAVAKVAKVAKVKPAKAAKTKPAR